MPEINPNFEEKAYQTVFSSNAGKAKQEDFERGIQVKSIIERKNSIEIAGWDRCKGSGSISFRKALIRPEIEP